MKYTLFIFRRDLRLIDNKGLNYALNNFKNVIPIFIFTPEQVQNNQFKSDNAVQFMIESLLDLDIELHKHKSILNFFYGDNLEVLKFIAQNINLECVVFNQDYTPYSIKRDKQISDYLQNLKIKCKTFEDYLLSPIGTFNKKDGKAYTIYTPFKNNVLKEKIDKPDENLKYQNLTQMIDINDQLQLNIKKHKNIELLNKEELFKFIETKNENILVKGGRHNALKMLNFTLTIQKYEENRNKLSFNTSHLSAYIKFGNLSIREIYHKFKETFGIDSGLIAQLIWREFYYYIAYYFPRVLEGENFVSKFDNIVWSDNNDYYLKWCKGETGFPVVDAGMRELNKTGYMHNRTRLITSNFLNRMLGMDWKKGELYFAQKLTDYDPSVNNGNWQWISSVGVDPKPFNQRLFNPFLQSNKFDENCEYIKKWIPSLQNVPNKHLHEWEKYYKLYNLKDIEYVKPVVDYSEARKRSVAMYRAVL